MHTSNNLPLIAISSVVDGSMSTSVSSDKKLSNRVSFLKRSNITARQTVLVYLQYKGDDYMRYFSVTSDFAGDGIITPPSITADALFTTEKNLALLLPVADCIGAVLYDPVRSVLGLAHLGRHNLIQVGGTGIVAYMVETFGSSVDDITVYLGPAAGRERYPLYDFNNRSLHEVAMEQIQSGGVLPQNIFVDPRDTAKDKTLFSHSEFLQGNQSSDGRQAIVTMMLP